MRTYKVKLNSIEKVKDFSAVISNVEGKPLLMHDQFVVNAKSILGIFSLDLSEPLELRMEDDTLPKELIPFLA